jgi:hypothetical protein
MIASGRFPDAHASRLDPFQARLASAAFREGSFVRMLRNRPPPDAAKHAPEFPNFPVLRGLHH